MLAAVAPAGVVASSGSCLLLPCCIFHTCRCVIGMSTALTSGLYRTFE